MTFNPAVAVQQMREHLEFLGRQPGWLDYTADLVERMVAEDHGLWKPLADLAKTLKEKRRGVRTPR